MRTYNPRQLTNIAVSVDNKMKINKLRDKLKLKTQDDVITILINLRRLK